MASWLPWVIRLIPGVPPVPTVPDPGGAVSAAPGLRLGFIPVEWDVHPSLGPVLGVPSKGPISQLSQVRTGGDLVVWICSDLGLI